MSIKVTIVENHVNKNIKQYNIDSLFWREFGSVNKFKSMLKNKRSKNKKLI